MSEREDGQLPLAERAVRGRIPAERVHVGPEMINSVIHRHGGPLFFVLSLIPLFVLLWWLRRQEDPVSDVARGTDVADGAKISSNDRGAESESITSPDLLE